MGLLVVREALKSSAQLPQACQLLSGIGPGREPCIDLLAGLQYTHEIIARPRGLSETRLGCGILLFDPGVASPVAVPVCTPGVILPLK